MESFASGSFQGAAAATTAAAAQPQCLPGLVSPQLPGPGWSFIFGLVVILIFIGFLLIFLVSRNAKQEKQLELLHRRINQLPPPLLQEDIVSIIDENHRRHFDNNMRRVAAMLDTRLNDFDQYYKSNFVSRHQQPVSKEQFHEPPPLEDDATCDDKNDGQCQLNQLNQLNQSQPPSQPPSQQSPPVQSAVSPSLASGLPSIIANLISNMSGSGASSGSSSNDDANNGVSIPMMIGEIMTVYTNQQARQARQMQPIMTIENTDPSQQMPATLSE